MHVIALSLSRGILDTQSRDYSRMRLYADKLGGYHIIVLTRKKQGTFTEIHEGNLHVYPTNAWTIVDLVFRAVHKGVQIARSVQKNTTVVTAQDPLEIGWMCFVIAKLSRIKLHIQVHGDYWSSNAWVGTSFLKRIRRSFGLVLLKRVPKIRVVSQRIHASLVERGIDPMKMVVLPIRPELEQFLSVQHIYKKEEDVCTFLFVGRFSPEKDIARIIRAFALVYAECPQTKLVLVGDGPLKKTILEAIQKYNLKESVHIEPWTQTVAMRMNTADVLVLASKHEAYGLVLLEAMAAGIPVVTTDVGCVGEVVLHERHGLVVSKQDDKAYADAMSLLAKSSELREKYGTQGRLHASVLAKKTESEYVDEWIQSLTV